MTKKIYSLLLFIVCGLTSYANKPQHGDIIVAQDGSAQYTGIQEAINAVPSNSEKRTVIYVKNGIYDKEKIYIPKEKKNISLIGENKNKTIISYHLYDSKTGYMGKAPTEDAAKLSRELLETSASITTNGDGFEAQNITFENTAGPIGQAQAITISSDRNIFIDCIFLGYQDTMFLRAKGKRSYFKDCLIIGRTDYIYGAGIAYFDNCEARSFGGGWITAPATPKGQYYGFVFNNCKLTYTSNSPRNGDDGHTVALGRPWKDYPKVIWIKCNMCKEIDPKGWPIKWNLDYIETDQEVKLLEYNNYGQGAKMNNRSKWLGLRAMKDSELQEYTIEKVLGGNDHWIPNVH